MSDSCVKTQTPRENWLTTGRKQYVEMNYGLSSGTEGEPSSSYRLAFCVELVTYSYNKKISRS